MQEGKNQDQPVLEGVTTYHDPCYLGRVNRIFDAPRDILGACEKDSFVEMPQEQGRGLLLRRRRRQEYGWKNTTAGYATVRMDDAIKRRGEYRYNACPYCLIMMEDAIKDKEKSETMKALDISEAIVKGV